MVLREKGTTRPLPQRQITFAVPARVFDTLEGLAEDAGVAPGRYAKTLFEAAFAARCGSPTDPDLDDAVARAIVLLGAGHDSEMIATAIGIPEARVMRILDAWRQETNALAGRARPAGTMP